MVTAWVKHMETPEGTDAGPAIMVSRTSFGLACSYIIDERNGSEPVVVRGRFPADKYAPLDYTPVNVPNRFVGWFTTAVEPTVEADASGRQLQPSEQVMFEVPHIYARWQLPANVTFDAATNGGTFPEGDFHYYVGQPFGALPRPVHPTLNFLGWFDVDGNKVTSSSIVRDGLVLIAQYTAAMYEVDLNGEWELSTTVENPDPFGYDGVYQSFSNKGIDNSHASMRIRVVGHTDFRVYIRSWAESSYDFTVALPADVHPEDGIDWDNSVAVADSAQAHTMGIQKSGSDIGSYGAVNYELDGGDHDIWIVYRKDSGVQEGDDRGYVLIPKEQGGAR